MTRWRPDRRVGVRLRARRTELGLTQRALAMDGVTYAYISRIEAGTRTPSLGALIALANRLDVSAYWLATGRDAPDDGHVCPFCGR